jgi:Zn-finger nucleic acid-binding protein
MTERQGIEIDYCPQCRGVWLDRGELDKIIERSMRDAAPAASIPLQAVPQAAPPPQTAQPYYDQRQGHDDKHSYDKHRYDSHGYPRKKSVWQELFD